MIKYILIQRQIAKYIIYIYYYKEAFFRHQIVFPEVDTCPYHLYASFHLKYLDNLEHLQSGFYPLEFLKCICVYVNVICVYIVMGSTTFVKNPIQRFLKQCCLWSGWGWSDSILNFILCNLTSEKLNLWLVMWLFDSEMLSLLESLNALTIISLPTMSHWDKNWMYYLT